MQGLVPCLLLSSGAPVPCEAPDAAAVEKSLRDVAKMPRMGALLKGLSASIGDERLDVDERVSDAVLIGTPRPTTIPLALPPGWSGTVEFKPRAEPLCARAKIVRFDDKLARVELEDFHVDVRVSAARRGGRDVVDLSVRQQRIRLAPPWIFFDDDDDELALFTGTGIPDAAELGTAGALEYVRALAKLSPAMIDDLHASKGASAQTMHLFELAERFRDLSTWTPTQRIDAARLLAAMTIPKKHRHLQKFWQRRLGPTPPQTDAMARLLVDDEVLELWVDGKKVFDEKDGSPRSVGVPVGRSAAQLWIVASESVHDTVAVLRPGVVYGVTRTYVALAGGGARRECVRVQGDLPSRKRLTWRELGTMTGPLLGPDEAFRPPFDVAERAVGVVNREQFPPVPLVYSYTHPGTYRWTVSADGGVELELLDDEKLCPP